MGRPHKYAASRLHARTTLSRERVLELGRAAATAAVGHRWEGRSDARLTASGPDGDTFAIHGAFLHKPKQMDFRVRVADVEGGARREVTTHIGWYMTTQMKAYWVIPVGTKTMVALPVYLQIVEDIGRRIRAEDPTASITLTKGERVIVSVDGRGPAAPAVPAAAVAPAVTAAPAPVPTVAPPAGGAPPSGGRACAACAAVPEDDDLYCGQCGTVLSTSSATTEGSVL